ncbi:hypothetical protein DNU06_15495 [Putridiphycobacter roseus]|uniref:Secretion system C-terminal sorting domain-containing protein n=1 Tax=Putridiphycobacter roseus TaxID=2219161 RepID=A0A2W1MZA0_9FLAO|nr:YCF48-related protein [Putridiphycobacter roseus]PZE15911.1 hypothetical protein DNU06_15495 [Putridiphycobacter roseus]
MKKINLAMLITLMNFSAFSQWNPLNINSGTASLNDVTFLNADTGFVVGGNWSAPNSAYFYTNDGGTNWNTSTISTYALQSIQFLNDTLGFISTSQATPMDLCYKTIDGGANWTSFNTALYNDGKIYFKSIDKGFHYSPSNGDDVAFTSNGGTSWTHYANGTFGGSGIKDIQFPTGSSVGYAVTAWGGEIYKTINDSTWTLSGQPTSQTYNSVYFVDDLTGYVLGTDTILKTIDGGVNWSIANANQGGLDIYCDDANNCYVLSFNTILKSTDGCSTFSTMSGITGSLNSFNFIENTAYAVGDGAYKLGGTNSIAETAMARGINVFPNPSNNANFSIDIPKTLSSELTINVYSLDGRIEFHQQAYSNGTQLKVETNLLNGLYIIELTDGINKFNSKIQIDK